jgi:hypothetical protein
VSHSPTLTVVVADLTVSRWLVVFDRYTKKKHHSDHGGFKVLAAKAELSHRVPGFVNFCKS